MRTFTGTGRLSSRGGQLLKTAAPGRAGGGRDNKGAKGHAWDRMKAGETYVLADVQAAGTIDRIWITIDDRSPEALRGLKLEAFWDGANKPAVSVPFGDFFLHGAGEMVPMETALFASPEGRSFVSYVPMPFRKSARLVLTNEEFAAEGDFSAQASQC